VPNNRKVLLTAKWLPSALQVKSSGWLKSAIFHAAMAYKQFWIRLGWNCQTATPLLDRLIFKKTQVCLNTLQLHS
jgi:hypothetical protein